MLKSKLNNFEIHLQGHFGDSKIRYQPLMCMELAPLGFSLSHCCCSMTRGKLNTGLLKSWVNRCSRIFIRYLICRKYFQDLLILIFFINSESYIFTQGYQIHAPRQWRSGRTLTSHAGDRGSIIQCLTKL